MFVEDAISDKRFGYKIILNKDTLLDDKPIQF